MSCGQIFGPVSNIFFSLDSIDGVMVAVQYVERNITYLLQNNNISATCVSEDKRWLATADKGPNNCMVIVWDTSTL